MSRTHKDKPYKVTHPEEQLEYRKEKIKVEDSYPRWMEKPGVKTKKRKECDTEYHWMTTPSWWTRLTMNRPQRLEGHLWERDVVKKDLDSLEEEDPPGVSHKPHIYYW
jgi:hypothetical protein